MPVRKIGILTGGGDVPGLNSVIKSVTYRSAARNIDVTGIRRGWEGLTHVNLDDEASRSRYILPLNRENTRDIEHVGGTMLHSSRTNPSKMKALPEFLAGSKFPENVSTGNSSDAKKTFDMSAQVVINLERLQIDSLIAIGGGLGVLAVRLAAGPNPLRDSTTLRSFSGSLSRTFLNLCS